MTVDKTVDDERGVRSVAAGRKPAIGAGRSTEGASKRRILLVEENRDGTVGGSQFCLLEIVQNLDRRRFEPLVLFYEDNFLIPEFRKSAEVMVIAPPRPVILRTNGRGRFLAPLATILQKAINAVRMDLVPIVRWAQLMRRKGIDVVHLNNGAQVHRNWRVASKLVGVKSVVHQRGYAPARPNPSYARYDRIVCISEEIRRELIRNTPALARNSLVIYDGLDVERFRKNVRRQPRQVRQEFGVADGQFLVGMVGNIKRWKGQAVLVEALRRLASGARDFHCLLVGGVSNSGDDRSYHEQLRRDLAAYGLQNRVTLAGERADVADIINALDVLVHASIEPEPLGRVIFEGMALGKPVIATNHGGPREILVDGRSGFLVTPADPARLAACLSALMNSPDLARTIGQAGHQRLVTEFSIARNIERVEEVYDGLAVGR